MLPHENDEIDERMILTGIMYDILVIILFSETWRLLVEVEVAHAYEVVAHKWRFNDEVDDDEVDVMRVHHDYDDNEYNSNEHRDEIEYDGTD